MRAVPSDCRAVSKQIDLSWEGSSRSVCRCTILSVFQQFTRSDPPDGDDVDPLPVVTEAGRRCAVRARHRHLP